MKNLIFILVLAVVTFITFASATPYNLKRGDTLRAATVPKGKSSLVSLMKRQAPKCEDPTYYPCAKGIIGCCPKGSTCIYPNHCSIKCTSKDNYCPDGLSCCPPGKNCVLVTDDLYGCESSD
jgi:hypothetical protein